MVFVWAAGQLRILLTRDTYGRTTDPAIIEPDRPLRPAGQTTGQLDGGRLGRAAAGFQVLRLNTVPRRHQPADAFDDRSMGLILPRQPTLVRLIRKVCPRLTFRKTVLC